MESRIWVRAVEERWIARELLPSCTLEEATFQDIPHHSEEQPYPRKLDSATVSWDLKALSSWVVKLEASELSRGPPGEVGRSHGKLRRNESDGLISLIPLRPESGQGGEQAGLMLREHGLSQMQGLQPWSCVNFPMPLQLATTRGCEFEWQNWNWTLQNLNLPMKSLKNCHSTYKLILFSHQCPHIPWICSLHLLRMYKANSFPFI